MSRQSAADAQECVFAVLAEPGTYPGAPAVRRIDTHGAAVFLAGSDVYKVKRAVRFPYMDYSTLARRKAACEAELALNQPNAPELYLGVVPITRSARGLELGGEGEVVEWAVHMRRFDESRTLDCTPAGAALPSELASQLAAAVAASHARAAPSPGDRWLPSLSRFIEEARDAVLRFPDLFPAGAVEALHSGQCAALDRGRPLLELRRAEGHVRRIHGDLHLGNIVLTGRGPVLFDAIEFDEDIATGDVLYDLAFLLMDLWVRGDRRGANLVFNRYLIASGTDDQLPGLAALPLFLSLRAAIRAHVTAARSLVVEGRARTDAERSARTYFDAAAGFLRSSRGPLVAIGGLSGTGKSTIAAELAPHLGSAPGAVHLRSDIERKRLFGVGETERLPGEAYGPGVTAQVYARLRDLALLAAKAGSAVVVDAVHGEPGEREAIEHLAREAGVPFIGVWLALSTDERVRRVAGRRGDASDAGPEVALAQEARATGRITWAPLDAARPVSELAAEIAAIADPA